MSDSRNMVTGGFVITAVVFAATAYLVYPDPGGSVIQDQVNKPLFEFDSKDVRSLSITKFDAEKNQFDSILLENSLVAGWRIPSRQNYPVDSSSRISRTAASLIGLVVLDVASEDPNDEETYGVVEPVDGLKTGQKGVGIKVVLKDREKQDIAAAIIGASVNGKPDQRFVRIPGQRFVYVCKYDPSILTTDLFAWINPKILQFETQWEIAKLGVDRYTASSTGRVQVIPDYELDVRLEDKNWKVTDYKTKDAAAKLPAASNSGLEKLRVALDDFAIMEVVRKNPILAQSLKKGEGVPNTFQILQTLTPIGFFLDDSQDPPKLYGAGGKVHFTSGSGIKYELWFGNLIPNPTAEKNDQRLVMVHAGVDESFFPMPPEPGKTAEESKGSDAPQPPKEDPCESTLDQEQDDDDREARRQYKIKLDQRNERIKKVKEAVERLNERYADWFYIIDNALYQILVPEKQSLIR